MDGMTLGSEGHEWHEIIFFGVRGRFLVGERVSLSFAS
jgi:hypothetical protein